MFEPHPYIVLIDDDEDDLEMLSASLEMLGLKTKSFISGEKAAYYLQLIADTSELPALVIVDYNMPGKNGQQVLDLIKSCQATKDIPVVIYSTSISHLFKQTLIDKGAFNCYVKPYAYADFNEQVGIFKELAWSFSSALCLA
jgi:CheY-like chemotaxis protein